jgi:hypothetical protein
VIENGSEDDVPPPGAGVWIVTSAVPTVAWSDAGIEARSCVLLTNVVVRSAPFQRTTEPATKPVPLTVSVKAELPAMALEGEMDAVVGAGFSVVNVSSADVPPPGDGEVTVTSDGPAADTSAAAIAARSSVLPTYVVARSVPFHRTTELATNPVPLTVSVKAELPAMVLEGEMDAVVGAGFSVVNVSSADVPPPGVVETTVTSDGPATDTSAAAIEARNSVPLTYVVVRSAPFHRTTELATNPVPLTVSVKAELSAMALDGDMDAVVGAGFRIVKARFDDVPPPGEGVKTVTCAIPAAAMSAESMAA